MKIFKRSNQKELRELRELKINKRVKALLLKRIDNTFFKSFDDFINIKIENKEYDIYNNDYKDLINNDIIVIDYRTKNNVELLSIKNDINSLLMSMIEY